MAKISQRDRTPPPNNKEAAIKIKKLEAALVAEKATTARQQRATKTARQATKEMVRRTYAANVRIIKVSIGNIVELSKEHDDESRTILYTLQDVLDRQCVAMFDKGKVSNKEVTRRGSDTGDLRADKGDGEQGDDGNDEEEKGNGGEETGGADSSQGYV